MAQYFEDFEVVDAKIIRQYEEIIALTDDVFQIANDLKISESILEELLKAIRERI